MTQCWRQASGTVELYFYGELADAERDTVERHIVECAECRRSLEELKVIRAALNTRPDIAAPADGDWSGFMARLEDATSHSRAERTGGGSLRRPVIVALSMAALLALVTMSVSLVMRQRAASLPGAPATQTAASDPGSAVQTGAGEGIDKGGGLALTELSEQHFERSKLVVLGLATKDPRDSAGVDWDYERDLASSLLSDTRLYRQAAEERGMNSLADVMNDLELVLLQTSMSDKPDSESLAQLQRLIRRRDLITKMDIVKTSGLVP